jgi:CBS domain-containing protein
MRCDEIMKRDLECISPDGSVEEAARQMRDANVGFLPVCGRDKKVLGTLTDRDIVIRVVAAGRLPSSKVSDAMTRDLVACRPKDDLGRAAELMSRHQKSRIVVIDESDRLVGVISLSDLARTEENAGARALRDITERETHV